MVRTKKTQNTHLTVTQDANGKVELRWDWDALLTEVRAATSIVAVTEAKVKKTRAKKATSK